jgi:hypothetical protein
MRFAGQESWLINESRWTQHFELALWVRAVERIDVPAGGIVPGPLVVDPVPQPSPGLDRAALAAEWASWWRALCVLPEWSPSEGGWPPQIAYCGPEFAGLAEHQPLSHSVMVRRWPEVQAWRTGRQRVAYRHREPAAAGVVAEVERTLGRRAKPFVLFVDVLALADNEIRAVGGNRFLVPESVRDGAGWAGVLRGLVEELA